MLNAVLASNGQIVLVVLVVAASGHGVFSTVSPAWCSPLMLAPRLE